MLATPSLGLRCRRHGGRLLLVLAACLGTAGAAHGWNAGGHRLTATIAWESLDAATRAQVAALLATHPDYPHWQARRVRTTDAAAAAFAEAATWADNIRSAPGFHDPDEAATPLRKGFPDMLRRRDWHYVNQLLGEATVAGGAIHRALPRLQAALAEPSGPQRAYALVWLLHLVGDLHQPLHVATRRLGGDLHPAAGDAGRRSRRNAHDGGGNALAVHLPEGIPGQRRRPLTSDLHAVWDALAAPSWLSGERLAASARRLMRETPPPAELRACLEAPRGTRARPACAPDFAGWRAATHTLAGAAYAGYADAAAAGDALGTAANGTSPTVLDDGYLTDGRRLAERQIALAGYRLALLLRAALRD